MIARWFRRRRRQLLLAQPIPAAWSGYVERNVPHLSRLPRDQQAKLRDYLRILCSEKNWEGCGGLTLDDEIKVTIAALASILLLGLRHDYFPRVRSILVYPSLFRSRKSTVGPDGVVRPMRPVLGEAYYRGPVILAWDEVLQDCRASGEGTNLVFHEFAHQLDMQSGDTNGTPPLAERGMYRRWKKIMPAEYRQLVEASGRGQPTFLDQYGATNPAEFFAVVSECFFDNPHGLRQEHPALYGLLRDYYGQDPASWPGLNVETA